MTDYRRLGDALPLPPNLAGMALMALTGLIFAAFTGIVRHVGTDLHPMQVAFLRYSLGLAFLLPFFLKVRVAELRSARLGLHSVRGMAHGIGVLLWFYAIATIPLAEVTALGFTSPIFATLFGALILGERIRARRLAAIFIGLAGALVIIRPGLAVVSLGAVAMLIASPLFAGSDVATKVLTRTEQGPTIVIFLSIFVTLVTLGPAISVWRTPTLEEFLWLAAAGALASLGHLVQVEAFRLGELGVVQPVKFLQLLWAALIGWVIFGEGVVVWTWIGGAMVVGSASYIAHREAVRRREHGTPGGGTGDRPTAV